jgi:site-specific DNA recombinase
VGFSQSRELTQRNLSDVLGSLHALLTIPIYRRKIKHKTDLYQGQHQAIVDQEIFDRVQAQLRENGFNRGNRLPSKMADY